jgi:hypothetical protein
MASAFTGDQIGFGKSLSDEQLIEVNQLRDNKDYVSNEAAESLLHSSKKPALTRRMFDDSMIDSPFLKLFRYGQNHDGYWTHRHMKIQFEDAVDCLKILYPGHDFLFLFDQSSGHTKKREGGLDAISMNVSFGGKSLAMRESTLFEGCIGPHAGAEALKVGDVQQLAFPESELCTANAGPFWMTPQQRLASRDDRYEDDWQEQVKKAKELKKELVELGIITASQRLGQKKLGELATSNGILLTKKIDNRKERTKTIAELIEELSALGFQFDRRSYRLPELQEIATIRNIDLVVKERKLIEGWAGKSKGLKQVLWETGWIDPSVPLSTYIKNGKKGRDFLDNGDLKACIAPFVLRHLMKSRPDFASETTDLQHLAEEVSDENSKVIVDFTPKYHAEIAGEGVENGWGFAKKILRRLPLGTKRDFDDFTQLVRESLLKVNPERSRRFRRRCRKYMLAYDKISEEAQENKQAASASFDRIEALVESCFKSVDSKNEKRKRKVKIDKRPQKQEFTRKVTVSTAYSQRGDRARGVRRKDNEQDRLDRLARTNDDIEIERQQATRVVHRSQVDTDTGYLDNEVRLFEIERSNRLP